MIFRETLDGGGREVARVLQEGSVWDPGVPFPALKPWSKSRDTRATVFTLPASSSAAELPPSMSLAPEPGTFPQEPPLDTLTGKLSTF